MDTVLNKKSLVAAFIAALSANTYAGEWQFKPQFFIDETFTDNVKLSVNDNLSSIVNQAGLELNTHFVSKNLEFTFDSKSIYAMYSHDHDIDNDFHTLDSNFRLKLSPQGLSLTGSAVISNQSRNSSRNALADIVTGDTVRLENYSAGLEYKLDNSDFLFNSGIQYRTVQSEDGIGEREGFALNLNTRNGKSARHIFWEATSEFADYTNQGRDGKLFTGELKLGLVTDYKITPFLRYFDETNEGDLTNNSSTLESDSYGGGVRWLINSRLFIDASYNTPTGNQLDLDGKEQENYTAVTIRWQPSQRTEVKIDYGQRFYGESYGLDLTHQNKRLTNTITYVEEVNAFTRNSYESILLGNYWCPPGDITDTSSCFISKIGDINFDDYQLINLNDFVLIEDQALSLNKQLQWSSELKLSRTTISISLNNLSRENLNTRVEDENKSASFKIKRKVSGKSNITFDAQYTDTHQSLLLINERQDRYRRYSLEYDKSLNSKLTVKLGVSHLNRSSTTQSFNYQEDRVYLNFSKGF